MEGWKGDKWHPLGIENSEAVLFVARWGILCVVLFSLFLSYSAYENTERERHSRYEQVLAGRQ
tara:strand:+ start:225 stop:413 length:189 start_codon:yes stop_codon:yes gene_type:complete